MFINLLMLLGVLVLGIALGLALSILFPLLTNPLIIIVLGLAAILLVLVGASRIKSPLSH